MENFKFVKIEQPKYAGCYELDNNIHFNIKKKPKLIHRLFCKWLLGWEWIDEK